MIPFIACEDELKNEKESIKPFNVNVNWRTLPIIQEFISTPYSNEVRPEISEISGICPSLELDDVYYIHEDSGTDPKIFTINANGEILSTIMLNAIGANDYEDISSFKSNGISYIFLADIGDNFKRRNHITIYKIKEPYTKNSTDIRDLSISEIEYVKLKYPAEFGPQDAEAFSVHPLSGELFLFTKSKGKSLVFKYEWTGLESESELIYCGVLNMPREQVTASDFSSDGKVLTVKTYEYIYSWNMESEHSLNQLFEQSASLLPYKAEVQGEAFCWSKSADCYFTVSEKRSGIKPRLNQYCKN